jgi:hypothetical protein
MNVTDGMIIIFFMLMARILLPGITEEVNLAASFAWITPMIALLTALTIGMGLVFLQDKCGGQDLLHTSQLLLGKTGFYLVGVFYAAGFLGNSSLLMRQFAENSALLGLAEVPLPIITVVYTITIGICLYFEIETITKTSFILFHFIIFWLFFIYFIVAPYYNFYNLLPWQGNGVGVTVYHGLENVGINIGVLAIIILAPYFKDLRSRTSGIFWGSLITILAKTCFILVFLLTLGVEVSREKINPFFEISSMAYFDRYFERLEAFSILLLVFIGIASISMSSYLSLYLIKRMFNLPTVKPLIPTWCVIIYLIAMLPESAMAAVTTDVAMHKFFGAGGMYVIPGILGSVFFLRRKSLFANSESKGG